MTMIQMCCRLEQQLIDRVRQAEVSPHDVAKISEAAKHAFDVALAEMYK